MPEANGARETGEFAALLRELKDRSGLSYGALAKRLHTSTSTLHRYCNGSAVPTEYAPVERLARACRATPEELVELHRRWILADHERRNRPDQTRADRVRNAPATAREAQAPAGAATRETDARAIQASQAAQATQPAQTTQAAPATQPAHAAQATREIQHADSELVVARLRHRPRLRRGRDRALIGAATAVAVLAVVGLAANVPFGEAEKTDDRAVKSLIPRSGAVDRVEPSAPAPSSTKPSPSARSRTPPASAPAPAAGTGVGGGPGSVRSGDRRADEPAEKNDGAPPFNVTSRPYVYESPCSQHFLVDSEPEQVGPPANEQDAPRWAAAYGAVSSGEQRVALTVQGTGRETVVLEKLYVRIVTKGAPLAWNDYAMGVGCGGRVDTASFGLDLDDGSPVVKPQGDQGDFPYTVSESEPQVFFITANTLAHDVRWDLSLEWSSGDRRGTLRIDDDGSPFRTSAGAGRPGYDYPLGGGEWIEREY
ncbi:helix-turn-helix transcriptional regulator [Streptomyces sp. ADI96-02]|uniref:helix-turn-helix domain-containing protein n=1 Tax=Streptomyces sp. ADI96-02 TaxID=1522760 RepID=UPI000F554483|nr:helix-turn-helix transcriptional regulator [Streptomyces sp. ADI96-02]